MYCTGHQPKVCPAVEPTQCPVNQNFNFSFVFIHVEVDAGVPCKDLSKDVSERLVRQDVVLLLEPIVKPTRPELAHQHWRVRPHSSQCFDLLLCLPLEVDRHQLVVDVAPVKGEGGGVTREQQRFDPPRPQLLLDETQVF